MIRILTLALTIVAFSACKEEKKKVVGREKGKEERRETQPPPDLLKGQCVLEIHISKDGEIFIDDHPSTKDSLEPYVRSFYGYSSYMENHPCRSALTEDQVQGQLGVLESKLKNSPSKADRINYQWWKARKGMLDRFGELYEMDSTAFIELSMDAGTSYGTYLAVLDELAIIVTRLQDKVSRDIFGKGFNQLSASKKRMILLLIPHRVAEIVKNATPGQP